MGSVGHRGADARVRTVAKKETSVPSQLCYELKTSGGSVVEFSLATWDTGFNSKLMPKKREKIHTQIVGVFSESLDKRPTSFPLHTLISLS